MSGWKYIPGVPREQDQQEQGEPQAEVVTGPGTAMEGTPADPEWRPTPFREVISDDELKAAEGWLRRWLHGRG